MATTTAVLLAVPETILAGNEGKPVTSISIEASTGILENAVTRYAVEDAINFLGKAFPDTSVSLNRPDAHITFILPEPEQFSKKAESRFSRDKQYDYLHYPDHEYEWQSTSGPDGAITLRLSSPSAEGTAFGLYGLLQEKLGFRFYHPRKTVIPVHRAWPLAPVFRWQATPRFDKKGFHIHSLHPTELAEQLNNPALPGSLADVKEYLDWLARNRQNLFQFYLLRDIDRRLWIEHAKEIVDYAHQRGIMIGVEFSLSCLQQKAFQAIRLLNVLRPYRKQIDDTLGWLFQAQWDFVTIDFSMSEYMPDLGEKMPELRNYLIQRITGKYRTKVFYATHIIQQQDCVNVPKLFNPGGATGVPIEQQAGILIHTVMFYSIAEPRAPVYGNVNQRYMLHRAEIEARVRETWYWPESAYWVAFDNSVPLLLLPYLSARWEDMNTMPDIGVENHLTFSSGWEWGYWLVDWSIAQWSWTEMTDGKVVASQPLSGLDKMFPDAGIHSAWEAVLAFQNRYLKELGLMPFLSALDPSAEMPHPFDSPFQPRLGFTFDWLLEKATNNEADGILRGPVALLIDYDQEMGRLVERVKAASDLFFAENPNDSSELRPVVEELTRGLQITGLRARHRALTLQALIAKRSNAGEGGRAEKSETLLQSAAKVRHAAELIVHSQEAIYRYPVDLLARRRSSLTAYEFGYLYPASDLFFWWREEEQVRHGRFDAFYLNIWDFKRISGIDSLIFRPSSTD